MLTALLMVVPLGGCEVGSVDDPVGGTPDAGGTARTCAVPEDFGALGIMAGATVAKVPQDVAGNTYRLNADLDAAAEKDVLSLQLWDDKGAFAGPVSPGTYTIGGADANFGTCGLCVTVLGDIVPMMGAREFYIAQSGTVVIDTVEPTLAVTVSDLVFSKFELTGNTLVTGCDTTIASAELSATLGL